MSANLTPDQKREYLRLLLAESQEAARIYLLRQRPVKMVFESHEEADEYFRQYEEETGDTNRRWIIIICPSEPEETEESD